MASIVESLKKLLGTVRLRQLSDRLRHQLSFVPGLYVIGAIVLAQVTLIFDRSLSDKSVPDVLATTVDSARSVFTAIAGGLITSITLLLSMMLVTVQLASSQFSPRTLRDWLGDKWLKHTVGIALGTTVFSLLALRSARSFGDEGGETVPHSSVIIAVVLGVIALFGVVRSVDHITQSLQIGSVARRIADETMSVIERADEVRPGEAPRSAPSSGSTTTVGGEESEPSDSDDEVPASAAPIEAPTSGWIQQIDVDTIIATLPDGATGYVVTPLGSFVPAGAPLIWVDPAPADDHDCHVALLDAFALGRTRTMQQDVGFGIVQLTDIAVRALSPGVNDPTTAEDVIVHLGDVMMSLWERPTADGSIESDGRKLKRRHVLHEEHLRSAFDPIRRYGATDPQVLVTLVRSLTLIRSEIDRRGLPGPVAPLDDLIADIAATAQTDQWSIRERDELQQLTQ